MVTFFDHQFPYKSIVEKLGDTQSAFKVIFDPDTPYYKGIMDALDFLYRDYPLTAALSSIRLLNLFVQLIYLFVFHCTSTFTQKDSSFFRLVNVFCVILTIRTAFWVILVMLTWYMKFTTVFGISLEISLLLDVWVDQFGQCMVFLLALNRLITITTDSEVFDRKPMIFALICMILTAITTFLYIWCANISRVFLRKVGFLDIAKSTGYQLLINRFFYIFPIGSVICYILLFLHFRKRYRNNRDKALRSSSNSRIGEQNVFLQLLITIFSYLAIAIIFEYANSDHLVYDEGWKIPVIAILNCVNNLPELLFPAVLLVTNGKFRRYFGQ